MGNLLHRMLGVFMLIEVKNLSKRFADNEAVKSLNLSFEKGVYGLLGANGAGKTTFMKMLCRILTPSSGSIFLDNSNIKDLGERYYDLLGYLPQDHCYYPDFTAREYLTYIALIKGIDKKIIKKRMQEVLDIVSLSNAIDKKVKTYSGGMKRRLGIAQAIINNPLILILDEPTARLDPKERIRFRNLLSKLSHDRIVILSTHIVSDIESIANKILIMKEGNIILNDCKENILRKIDNYVWICRISYEDSEIMQKKYIVSNIKSYSDGVEVRIITDKKPHETAERILPTLEDLYMFYFNEFS